MATSEDLRTRLRAPELTDLAEWNVLPEGALLSRGAPLFRRIGA